MIPHTRTHERNPKSFFPKPKVDSTLLSFVPRKDFFHIKKPANLEKITRIFFNQRRKMIKNPLRQIFKNPDHHATEMIAELGDRDHYSFAKPYQRVLRAWDTPDTLINSFDNMIAEIEA